MNNCLGDESWDRAVQLAYFIHGDRAIAVHITREALAKLEITLAAQYKRFYYELKGRPSDQASPQAYRTKVSLGDRHLFQYLIYIESERFERQQEQSNDGAPLAEEDMIIRFIKHLVSITLERSSFYVTLGLSRLLYNYSTAETMRIYDLIVQDPARMRNDCYYRAQKGHLMEELQQRFGDLIKTFRGPHGEKRFETQDRPARWAPLVSRCLHLFTPWDTRCPIPDRFDPFQDELTQLTFRDPNPNGEHSIEVNRIHAALDPTCFLRLTRALHLDPPEQRLAIPQFFFVNDKGDETGPRGGRSDPPKLSNEERKAIRNNLAEQANRRKRFSDGSLLIVVDGIEHARLDLNRASRVRFEVEEGARLIEVRGRDEEVDLLLAVYLLAHEDSACGGKPLKSWIVLEGGQKLSFTVTPTKNAAGEIAGAVVEVRYQETNPVRASSLLFRQFKRGASESLRLGGHTYSEIMKTAFVSVFIAACLVVGLMLYHPQNKEPTRQPPPVTTNRETQTIQKDNPPANSLAEAARLNDLGNVARQRGDLAAAKGYHQSALAIQEKLTPNSLDVAASLYNLGCVASQQGDLVAARKYHEQALVIQEKLAPDSLDVAKSLDNLGTVTAQQGDLVAAEEYSQRALAIKEKLASGPGQKGLTRRLGTTLAVQLMAFRSGGDEQTIPVPKETLFLDLQAKIAIVEDYTAYRLVVEDSQEKAISKDDQARQKDGLFTHRIKKELLTPGSEYFLKIYGHLLGQEKLIADYRFRIMAGE